MFTPILISLKQEAKNATYLPPLKRGGEFLHRGGGLRGGLRLGGTLAGLGMCTAAAVTS